MSSAIRDFKYNQLIPSLLSVTNSLLGNRGISQSSENFFFILGSGRNGSTLLSSILNNDTSIFIPPEQYVLPFAAASWQLRRDKSQSAHYSAIISKLLHPNHTSNWQLIPENFQGLEGQLNGSFCHLYATIYHRYALEVNGVQPIMVGDKSPLNTHFLKLFIHEFGSSKFIFLVRDPRDVIASFKKVENHKANDLKEAIWKWEDAMRQYEWLHQRKNVLLVHYESLVRQPQEELIRVYQYLGLEMPDHLLNQSFDREKMGVSDLSHHQNLKNPINAKSIGKWKNDLNADELRQIQRSLSKLAINYGYDLSKD